MDPWTFILITDRQGRDMASYVQFIAACSTHGITSVQLREKGGCYETLLELGQRLLDAIDIPLIVNDSVELALELGAAGVHLGQTDLTPVPEGLLTGVSIDQIDQINQIPADYIAANGVFPSPSKSNLEEVWGTYGLKEIKRRSNVPVVAIGGITLDTIDYVIDSGADGIAVIDYVHTSDNPFKTIGKLCDRLS